MRMGKGHWGTVGRVADVDAFDEIEFQAARTGNHVRAAVRMSELARGVEPGMRAESHLRVGEQWMMADEPQQALDNHYATAADTRFLGRGGHVRRFAGEYGGVLLPHIGRCLGVQAAVRPCVRRASCLGR